MGDTERNDEVWHCPDTRSFWVLWALEEIGVPYEIELMQFPPRERHPSFLDVNPLGTVPAFRDGSSAMTESSAIVHYLGCKYPKSGLSLESSDPAYADWLNWMYFSDATLTFPQTLILRYGTFERGRADNVVSDYTRWFLSRLKHVDRQARQSEWLCAARFTGADITVGYALLVADFLKLAGKFPADVADYLARLQARPAFVSAKRKQGIDLHQALAGPG